MLSVKSTGGHSLPVGRFHSRSEFWAGSRPPRSMQQNWLCGVLVPLAMTFVWLGRFPRAGIGHMVVIAIPAEWLSAAFRFAVRADGHSTVRAIGNGWLSTADRVAFCSKFDKAARASHSPTPHRLDRNHASLGLVRCAFLARIIRAFRSSANIADSGSCTTC
jgi:hypothetical protein